MAFRGVLRFWGKKRNEYDIRLLDVFLLACFFFFCFVFLVLICWKVCIQRYDGDTQKQQAQLSTFRWSEVAARRSLLHAHHCIIYALTVLPGVQVS